MSDLNKLDNLKAAAREGKWPTVWTEKKALALLAKLSTPDTIIELFERLEAAEAKYTEVSGWYAKMKTRMLAAEAELARRDKEAGEPVILRPFGEDSQNAFVRCEESHPFAVKLYAAQPAALPPEILNSDAPDHYTSDETYAWVAGANWMREHAKALGVKPLRVKKLPKIKHPAQFDYADEVIEALKAQGIEVEE